MKNIKFLFLGIFIVSAFMSCDKYENTAEASKTTFLPKLTLLGEPSIVLDCSATSYSDAGLTAEEQGTAIPVTTVISGNYFGGTTVDGSDVYSVSYSAENKDGIPGSLSRKIVWEECNGDFVTSIAGMYKATVKRTTLSSGNVTAGPQYTNMAPIIIKDLGGGKYAISDAITGWYTIGRGLGFTYAATGMVVTANDIPGNSFTHDQMIEVGGFGGALGMSGFSIDPATKTITITTDWEFGFQFVSTLTQI